MTSDLLLNTRKINKTLQSNAGTSLFPLNSYQLS